MTDDVSATEKKRRRDKLDRLQKEVLTRKNQQLLGSDVEVLVEKNQKGKWCGRTPQNKLVFFDDNRNHLGQKVRIRIENTGPYSLNGKVLQEAVV